MQKPEIAELVLPGLLEPPLDGRESLVAAALSTLLSRATPHDTREHSFEAVLGKVFDCIDEASGGVPVAALEWPARFGAAPHNGCLRADPVHLQVDRDHARLLEGDALDLELGEARALAESINAHFADDGLHFRVADSQRWFLSCTREPDVDMSPPGYAAGRNVQHFLPGGDSGAYWRALLTELQMLLHEHPVNRQRQARGALAVNSVWLWGGGRLADTEHRASERTVYADGVLPAAMAERLHSRLLPLPARRNQASFDGAFTLVDDTLLPLAVYGRTAEWRAELDRIESIYLKPVLGALKRGRFAAVVLYPCLGQRFEVRRSDLAKFWRKRPPLRDYFGDRQQSF